MTQNRKSECFEQLKSRILAQTIAPGSDLDEVSLSAEFGISRTPLREVLHRLAGAGYVTLQSNRGAKVASMDLQVMRVFFQTAPLIYSTTARLAAENRSAAQLDTLKETQQQFSKAAMAHETSAAALLNHRFHEIIGEMAANPYISAALNRMLIDHTRLGQMFFRPETKTDEARIQDAIAQHDAMIQAIADRDADLAIELTLQHWELSRDRMERYVRPDPLPLEPTPKQETPHAI